MLMLVSQVFPQMTLVSSTPADGDVSVLPASDLVLQFSSPLDTTAMFEDFFLGVELFPENKDENEPEILLSDDLRTMTVKGLKFEEDERYTMMLWGAVNTSGDSLDRPYVVTWSTGAELPAGQINGTVNWSGGNPAGALVAFFEQMFDEDPIAITVANPAYTANYMPNGSYYVVSICDTNGDGPEFMKGDAVGLYDANDDGIPDKVEVAGGNTLNNVDITLSVNSKTTARGGLAGIEAQAADWASDAGLIGVFSEGIETDGTSYGWSYLYYSESVGDFRILFDMGSMTLNQPFKDDEEPPVPVVIHPDWIDSDSVLAVALANGLTEFWAEYGNVDGHVSLHAFFSNSGEQDNNGNQPPADSSGFSILSKRGTFSATMPRVVSQEEPRFVWSISFYTDDRMEGPDGGNRNGYFNLGVDAHTGEVIFGGKPLTARQALDAAEESAKAFAADAQLLNLATYGLNHDGGSDNWHFKFYSQSRNELLELTTRGTSVGDMRHFPKDEYYHVAPVDVDWIDSDSAVVAAKANGLNDFLNTYPYAWGSATLERFDVFQMGGTRPMYKGQQENDGFKPGPLVWRIRFEGEWDGERQPRFEIVLDAESGDVFLGGAPVTARQASEVADSLATVWAEDAALRFVESLTLTPEGSSDLWIFRYTSVTKDSAFDVAANATRGFVHGAYYYGNLDTFNVSNNWLDSDAALNVAYENGLGEYLSTHPEAGGVATLTTSYQMFGYYPPADDPNHTGDDSTTTTSLRKGASESVRSFEIDLMTLWSIRYYPAYGGDEWQIVMNAETGEVLSAGSTFSTAREFYGPAFDYAAEWADDAALVDIESNYIMPGGRGDRWYYNFFSTAKDSFVTIGVNRGFVAERWTYSAEFSEHNPPVIDFEWIDSDSATAIAMDHGLRGLFDNEYNGGANGRASLRPYFPDSRFDRPFDGSDSTTTPDSGEVIFAWSLLFDGYNGQSFAIDIDAKTGAVLFVGSRMTAREAFEHAFPFASEWRDLVHLICVESYHVDHDGRSDAWKFRFSAPNVDMVLVVEVKLGRIQGFWEETREFLSSFEPLPEDWKNSNEVTIVADDHSGSFRDRNSNAWVEAKLSRGLWNDDMEKPVWGFRYHAYTDNGGMDSTQVLVDAVTASMIVSAVESSHNGLPATFSLEQNYPNPFNPETNIKYQLASQTEVKLAIFNVLGQRLITLVDDVQPAGIYEVRWNGRDASGIQQPSGMYIYQIESSTFTKTRRMLLVR
jgi:hypothetical protein